MHFRLQSFIRLEGRAHRVQLFAYRSRSLPGLEIIGAGQWARILEAKLLFLSKQKCRKIPLARYRIGIDGPPLSLRRSCDLSPLELPILLLFWTMAEQLKIASFENCLAAGKVSSGGHIDCSQLVAFLREKQIKQNDIVLVPDPSELQLAELRAIPLASVFAPALKMSFGTYGGQF